MVYSEEKKKEKITKQLWYFNLNGERERDGERE